MVAIDTIVHIASFKARVVDLSSLLALEAYKGMLRDLQHMLS